MDSHLISSAPAGNPTDALLLDVLGRYWGYDSFRPHQREAMQCVLEDRDSVVVLPTGGGKSLCYQAPAMCREGVALIVSPLISLMKDQVDALSACGIPAAALNSTLTTDQRRRIAGQLRSGELKLLYAAPERLLMDRTLEFLAEINVALVAVDEAHCISAWGHDFRPEYRGLRRLAEVLPGRSMHAYTATASEKVRQDIAEQLGLASPTFLVGSFDRPNLLYRVQRGAKKLDKVLEVAERRKGESGIVYCISRKEVERTAAALAELGFRAAPYHAGLSDDDRRHNQEAFIQGRTDVIVATVAFGMGIDKPDVRYVIHAGMPKSLEHYQQESGRAGRDSLEAECLLLANAGDTATWRRMLESDGPEALDGALQSLAAMNDYANSVECRHRSLVAYFGQRLDRDNCGACDVCLGELELVEEPLILAQKIVSCVVRLEQRFGADYTAKVLAGSAEERILAAGHDRLSTYGLLKAERSPAIRDWIEQLVGQGFLVKAGEFNVLQVTDVGLRLLKGDASPKLLQASGQGAARRRPDSDDWEGVDPSLFEQLRKLRAEIASDRAVPAYVVFGDTALRDMARLRPSTLEGFSNVRGVGSKKLQDFGETFVAAITAYCTETRTSLDVFPEEQASPKFPPRSGSVPAEPEAPNASALTAFRHFRDGGTIDEAAELLGRARSTVVGYLNQFLRHHEATDPSPWVDAASITQIEEAIEQVGGDRLKPIYEHLNGEVDYDRIRIVTTCIANRGSH